MSGFMKGQTTEQILEFCRRIGTAVSKRDYLEEEMESVLNNPEVMLRMLREIEMHLRLRVRFKPFGVPNRELSVVSVNMTQRVAKWELEDFLPRPTEGAWCLAYTYDEVSVRDIIEYLPGRGYELQDTIAARKVIPYWRNEEGNAVICCGAAQFKNKETGEVMGVPTLKPYELKRVSSYMLGHKGLDDIVKSHHYFLCRKKVEG
jgi:hypothetical protein